MPGSIDRREFLRKTAIAGGVAAGTAATGLSGLFTDPAYAAVGARWGALALPAGGQHDQQTAVATLERQVGRKFYTTHYRMPWTSPLVNGFTKWSHHSGHPRQILSWFARTKAGPIGWRGIADGNHDAWITRQARMLKAVRWNGYFCFHKEPEDEGNADDWKAAYHRVHQIFSNVGVTGFRWVVCLMASTYSSGDAGAWIPDRYGLLGVDAYNRGGCRNGADWRPLSQIAEDALRFARRRDKKLYIIETGCVEGSDGRKADWMANAHTWVKRHPGIVGVSYNHENSDCNYHVDTTSSSLAAFRRWGQDNYFGG